jgi:hypothetical protein
MFDGGENIKEHHFARKPRQRWGKSPENSA